MKRRYIHMPLETVANLFRESEVYTRVTYGIPKTAKLIQSGIVDWINPAEPTFYMTFEDDSFPELEEGKVEPPIAVQVESKNL